MAGPIKLCYLLLCLHLSLVLGFKPEPKGSEYLVPLGGLGLIVPLVCHGYVSKDAWLWGLLVLGSGEDTSFLLLLIVP